MRERMRMGAPTDEGRGRRREAHRLGELVVVDDKDERRLSRESLRKQDDGTAILRRCG